MLLLKHHKTQLHYIGYSINLQQFSAKKGENPRLQIRGEGAAAGLWSVRNFSGFAR